jgi:hypothetical protein
MSRVNPVMKSAKPHMCYLQYTGDGSPDPREFARRCSTGEPLAIVPIDEQLTR